MATVNLYETTITGTTGDNDVALSSEIDFIDDDETDSCLFVVRSDYSVAIGDELNYYDYRNINIFSGIVRDIKNNNPKEVLVFKYDMLLADRTVNDVFEGYTIEGLIQYIVETYSSLTFSSTFVSGITIEKYVSKNKNALSVVKDLIAQVPNLTYDVSNSKVFTLFVKSSVNSGSTLENGVNCRILNGWTQNTSKQVTRLTLIGAKQVQQGKTETFSGDGSTATFTISEIPSSIQVIVGGVEQELSVDGQRDGNYTVSPETKKVTFLSGSIPASGTNNITITYTFEIDITIEFDADDSIIQKYGIIERTITKKYINKMDDAFDYSSQHIEKFAEPLLNARVQRLNSIDITNLTPGYNIFIKDEINKVDGANVSGFFTIKSVKRLFPEGSLIIEVGELGVDGIEIIKEANYNIKQLYESDNNSSIIQKSQTLKNKVKIKCKSELELQLYRDLPDDYMYLANEIPNLKSWWTGDNNVVDRSQNNNNVTWVGTEAYTIGHIWDSAIQLNGSAYLNAGDIFSPPTISNTTIAFWINLDTIITDNTWGGQEIIIGIRKDIATFMYFGLRNSEFVFRTASGGLSDLSVKSNQKLGDTHIILEWNTNNTFSMWVDGVLAGTQTQVWSDSTGYGTELWIGRYPGDYVGSPYTQVIEDIRHYQGILNENEKLSLYNESKGQRGNANFKEIGDGIERPLRDETSDLTSGLLHYWDFDEDSGTSPQDSVGTKHLTLQNGALISEGKIGNSIYYDGVNDYTSGIGTEFVSGEPFSYSFWFNRPDIVGNAAFFGYNTDNSLYLFHYTPTLIRAQGITPSPNYQDYTFPTIAFNTWHHVVMTRDSSNMVRIYLNGVESSSGAKLIAQTFNFQNIAKYGSSTGYYKGYIDELGIWDRDLSESEVSELYNDGEGLQYPFSSKDEIFYITDKDYWANPDYEIAQTGSLQSWKNI
jgi:hypothetical protein